MATNLTIAVNADTTDSEYGTGGVDWIDIDTYNDYLIFTDGSDVVKDGESLPSSSDLNQAGIKLTGNQIIVSKYLLADFSASKLKEIHNMGNQNKRYVLAFVFDGETASEPVLEVWDNDSLNTINAIALGEGTPSQSWYYGITTTDGLPGENWIGNPLAGSSSGHFLYLNNGNGAISSAKTLYCNLKIIIPIGISVAGAENPVISCKYTTN